MAQYKKNWGSQSTHFTKSVVPSSAARMSKAAEDKYQKEMQQLRSMKDVAAFESRQAQTSASMASKAAEYELGALRKFSGKLDTFLNTTGKEMYRKSQEDDLTKKIQKYESSDLKDQEEWDAKQKELQEKIAAISENNAKRAQLQEDLKKHNLTSPNDIDPAGLSGNEKLAYLTVKSRNTLENAELNYNNWINDQIASNGTIDATWKPKIKHENGEVGYEKIEVGSINHPDGKRELKKLFLKKTMEENPMAGLKNEWRTLILAGPLKRQLDGLQALETQQYNKDQARIQDEAADQASFNLILGAKGYSYEPTNDPNLTPAANKAANDKAEEKHNQDILEGVLQSKRFNYTKHKEGTYRKGVADWYTKALQQVTELTDGEKMEDSYTNLRTLFFNTKIRSGPNKGKTMSEAFPDLIDDKKVTIAYANAYNKRGERLVKAQTATLTASRGSLMNQIKSNIESAKTEEAKLAAIQKGKKELQDWTINAEKTYKNAKVREFIFAQTEDPEHSAMLKDEDDWKATTDDLRKQFHGVVPLKEVGFMPNSVREKLEREGVRFVRTIPGAENKRQITATEDTIKSINKELRLSEKKAGQANPNGDSTVIDDLANDVFHNLLQKHVIDEDVQWSDAHTMAEDYLLGLIRSGRSGDPEDEFIKKGPMEGQRNPFWVKPDKTGSAWGNSVAMNQHREHRRMLLTFPEAQYRHANRKVTAISMERKVDYSKDYLFTPIEIDRTKEAGEEGYIKLDSIRHLGLDPTELPGYIIQQQAKRLGKDVVGSPAQFRKKQRDALIHQSGGINSPIWQDPALIEAWGLKGKIQWQESQRSALLKKAESSLLYKIYSLGGRL